MDGYKLGERLAYNHMTFVTLYQATSLARNNRPVVLKEHEFHILDDAGTQEQINACLNAALFQAKVQHPNACDVLEVKMKIDKTNCFIYHVLEALDTSVGKEIEAGKRYSEQEMREFLQQTASVLACAHSKGIAHRDVKPDNVFRTAHTFKLGDFGCFFEKRQTSYTKSCAGDDRYMSPQLREACMRGSLYNAFKADVFALGASLLHMATLTSPYALVTAERMQEAVGRTVEALPCSAGFKRLIGSMLAYEERDRPSMQQVCVSLVQPEEAELPQTPTTMAGVWENTAFLYDIQSQNVSTGTLSVNLDGGSFIEAGRNQLLCVGGTYPSSSAVHSLDLSSFQLSPLPFLSTPRVFAGLAKVNAHFYVLGGFNEINEERLGSCEKMQLSDTRWTQISSMKHPRGYFTPCHFRSLLYLASAGVQAVETFNADTEVFAVLPVSLPPQLRARPSVAFIAHGELCLVTGNKQMARWKIETEREFRLYDTKQGSCSTQQPLLVGSLVLIASCREVQKFSLETYSFLV